MYLQAKERARDEPQSLLCIAIDGSDQSSYAAPYFRQETKDTSKGWKMRMKLIGALGTGRMCMFYTILSNWESGAVKPCAFLFVFVVCLTCRPRTGDSENRKEHPLKNWRLIVIMMMVGGEVDRARPLFEPIPLCLPVSLLFHLVSGVARPGATR